MANPRRAPPRFLRATGSGRVELGSAKSQTHVARRIDHRSADFDSGSRMATGQRHQQKRRQRRRVQIATGHRNPFGSRLLLSERENNGTHRARDDCDGIEKNGTHRRKGGWTHLDGEAPPTGRPEQGEVRDVVKPPHAATIQPNAQHNVTDRQTTVGKKCCSKPD